MFDGMDSKRYDSATAGIGSTYDAFAGVAQLVER
jgi:hypothetical protein